MLIDRWVAGERAGRALDKRSSPHVSRFLMNHRHQAERFTFTDEATEIAARMMVEKPAMWLNNLHLAWPAYPTICIDYNPRAWVRGYDASLREDTDYEVCHFMHEGTVATLSSMDGLDEAIVRIAVCPWMYVLTGRYVYVKDMVRVEFDRLQPGLDGKTHCMASLTLGSGLEVPGLKAEVVQYAEQLALYFEPNVNPSKYHEIMRSFVGEMRIMMQLMMFLNMPKYLQYEDVPTRRQMTRNGPVAIRQSRMVRIVPRLTIHTVRRHLQKLHIERTKPGLHKVRPHHRHFDKVPTCAHEFPFEPTPAGVYKCAKCTQWYVHVKSHKRGDPARPVVREGYKI